MNYSRRLEIEKAVADLMEDYGPISYPLNTFNLAKRMGISSSPYEEYTEEEYILLWKASDDAFTLSVKDYSLAVIAYNQNHPTPRRLPFSMTHEIAHIWLEHEEDYKDAEREADYFAGYLLAPHPVIIGNNLSLQDIGRVFQISGGVAEIAYEQACRSFRNNRNFKEYERRILRNSNLESVTSYGFHYFLD